MHTITTRKFRQYVIGRYRSLVGNEPFLRFFHYLCFATFCDQDTHELVLPTRTMAENFFQQPYTSAFNGLATLEKFRDEILPGLKWSEPTPFSKRSYKGKARQIIDLGFDSEMQAALQREWMDISDDCVDFITGRDHRRSDRYREDADTTAQYDAEMAQVALNPTQRRILDYLRQLNAGHLILRKVRQNDQGIEGAIEALPPHVQNIRHRIMAAVRHSPMVYYRPSTRAHTARLSAAGDSILGLKKHVRRAATKGWWEADLRSSQFAILAATLKAPKAQAFIASGESIWREFNRFMFGIDAEPTDEIKKPMKEAMYSLCFGKGKKNLRSFLSHHDLSRLLEHPILQELLSHRATWFAQIRKNGGAHDIWGTWHAVTEDRWAGAVAGTVIQSIEMEIIAPIFTVAAKHGKSDQFKICLFQHDGATVSFNDKGKTARAQAKLKKAVEDRARELGVSTVLEFTRL